MADGVFLPRELQVLDKAELCVAGGGLAGVAAALTAAEAGVDTVLLEERGALGWEVSHGLDVFLESGVELPRVLQRIVARLSEQNAARDGILDPVATECLLDKLLQEHKVRVHFRVFAGAFDAGKGIVRVTTKSGPLAVQARVCIDATETSRLVSGGANANAGRMERACLLCAVEPPTSVLTVPVEGVVKVQVRPTLWPHEAHVRISVDCVEPLTAESASRFALTKTIETLRRDLPGFAKASLALSGHETFVLNPGKLDATKLAANVFAAGPRVLGRKPTLQERVELGAKVAARAIDELRVNA